MVSTHRYTESSTEADGLGVLLNNLHRLRGDGTIHSSVNVGRVLQERFRLTALFVAL